MREAEEQAIGWLLRLREAHAEDWLAFTDWLEQDPLHAAAYDRVAAADADAGEMLGRTRRRPISAMASVVAPAMSRAPPRYWTFAAGLAAALVASIGGTFLLTRGESTYAIATSPGEHREVKLADGTRIELNGETRLLLDRRRPRFVELASGEANFTVTHNPGSPFELKAGDAMLRDVGTSFDVRRRDDATEVSVADGSVLYNPDREAMMLAAGDRVRDPDGPATAQRSRVSPAAVAQWRSGQLSFDNERFGRVVAEITATSGAALSLSPALVDRRFTGIIMLGHDPDTLVHRLEPLLDVAAVRRGSGWMLVPAQRGGQ